MSEMQTWQELKTDAYRARRRGDYEQAVSSMQAAIEELGNNTAQQCVLLNGLADLYDEIGDCKKALEIAHSILPLRRSISADYDILLGNDLMFLAMILDKVGEQVECVAFAEEGVGIYQAVFGDNHSETQRMSEFLAQAKRKGET